MAKQWFGVDYNGMVLMKRFNQRDHAIERSQGKRVTGPIPADDIQQARTKAKQILRKDQPRYGRA